MPSRIRTLVLVTACPFLARAQQADSDSVALAHAARLPEVVITASAESRVVRPMPELEGGVLYAGKKSEIVLVDSIQANVAQNVSRQILGRVPGAVFAETGGSGFPSNGIGFRGLDPTQSVEMIVRQDGVNIAADIFGYPETYYTPPAEALERVDVVRGAASLAFGPQFGGMLDYVIRNGRPGKPQITSSLTTGSYGAADLFAGVGGGTPAVTYYGFVDADRQDGWRPNSDFQQLTIFGRATYNGSPSLAVSGEVTMFRNRIHMAGGLDDSAFEVDPRASFRARNWLASPWNIAALRARYDIDSASHLLSTLSYTLGTRDLVWRNEDGGPAAPDLIDPVTGDTISRETESETFGTLALETRYVHEHVIGATRGVLSAGFRVSVMNGRRYEGGVGTNGSDFDMQRLDSTWEVALALHTSNAAAFAEELVHVSDRLSIVPGARFEYVRSTLHGYTGVSTQFEPATYAFPLFGVGASYLAGAQTEVYANVSQAYRPVLYQQLSPLGSIARVAPGLRSSQGWNADLGARGTLGDMLSYDVGLFYLWYGDRIGERTVSDSGGDHLEIANIGSSAHRGVESYLQLNAFPLLGVSARAGVLSLFASFAFVDARYVSGEFEGNRVEHAPQIVERFGATYALGRVATTLQLGRTSEAFGDANNNVAPTDDAAAGLIPGYTLIDWSLALRLDSHWRLTAGINNVANAMYFTTRTAEYPGPGILPGGGRSVYVGVGAAY